MSILSTFFKALSPKVNRDDVSSDYKKFTEQKYELFSNLSKDEEIIKSEDSIVDKSIDVPQSHMDVLSCNSYGKFVYGAISGNKVKRLNFYRSMAASPEVADAIDEICDNCINVDDEQRFIRIRVNDESLDAEQIDEIISEFNNFISLFDFDLKGWEYFRDLIREGEVVWENIVSSENPDDGIVAINRLPCETFEYLINKKYEIEGILLNARALSDSPALAILENDSSIREKFTNVSIDVQQLLYRNYTPTNSSEELIPMHKNQITLVTTGAYSEDKMISYPILEKARRPYRQLTLLEDASIIYKLVRAPQRLMFNVSTGTMPASKAEQFVEKMKRRFQSKRIYDPMTGGVSNDYDPHQMLENYWFPKPDNSNGTVVSTIGGDANAQFGQLDDLKYFLQKLYRSLKVPFRRFSDFGSGAEVAVSEKPTYEEYRFSKFITRLQQRMALGIQQSFITHLKLKKIFEKFDLNKRSFQVYFNPPSNYDIYEKTKLLTTKLDLLKKVAESGSFISPDVAFAEIWGWSEEQMNRNMDSLKKWRIRMAEIDYLVKNIAESGNPNGKPIEDTVSTES